MSSARVRLAAVVITAAVAITDVVAGAIMVTGSAPPHRAQAAPMARTPPPAPAVPPTTGPPSSPAPTPLPALTPSPTATPSPVVHARPDTVWIPVQHVRAPIDVCQIVHGELDPPHDVQRACFWAGGAHLQASRGSSVIAGHINWVGQGTGALGRIGQLRPGDVVKTTGNGGVLTVWKITRVWRRSKSRGLDPRPFVGASGPRRLYLITCGGAFDAADANYLDNIYVEAVPALK